MKSESEKQITQTNTMSGYNEGWKEIKENQAWDDFLAWCRAQENGPHE